MKHERGAEVAGAAGGSGTSLEPAQPLVELSDVQVHYALRGSALGRLVGRSTGAVKALDGVNLSIRPGEVVGLVGESGSGKSTLGRAVLGLAPVTGGSITYRGGVISGLPESKMRPLRAKLQMIFQDPAAALNPTMTIEEAVADALRIHGVPAERRAAGVAQALERVGLAPAERFSPKYPSELSGGQKQRAVIARAIALDPELLVADEPISMLDMSVRSKILNLLSELRTDLGIAFIYITHDLASARFFCDRIAIMYLGRIVETGPTEEIFQNPKHPYTRALLAAVPDVSHRREDEIELPRGEVPDAANPPDGCPFHPRCPQAFERCGWEARDLRVLLDQRWTSVPLEVYQRESALVPDLGKVVSGPDGALVRSAKPQELAALLEEMRSANPDEPFFAGLLQMSVESGGVRLQFAPSSRPNLLPLAGTGAAVACHLYG